MRLYCYSEERAKKGGRDRQTLRRALRERVAESSTRGCRGPAPARARLCLQRIGRIQEPLPRRRAAITPWTSSPTRTAARQWPSPGSAGPLPAPCSPIPVSTVYAPMSHDWDPQTLWRTYTMLTDLEAVFRSLKSELGLRPIFHKTPEPLRRHLFITVIAYQLVQTIRRRSPNTERTPVGPLCAVSSKASTVSPPPSAERDRSHPPRTQGHPCRATPTQNLHRSRSRPRTRRCHQIDRLNTLTVEM